MNIKLIAAIQSNLEKSFKVINILDEKGSRANTQLKTETSLHKASVFYNEKRVECTWGNNGEKNIVDFSYHDPCLIESITKIFNGAMLRSRSVVNEWESFNPYIRAK